MSKKVLIISASPRKGGNSETLADEFALQSRIFIMRWIVVQKKQEIS